MSYSSNITPTSLGKEKCWTYILSKLKAVSVEFLEQCPSCKALSTLNTAFVVRTKMCVRVLFRRRHQDEYRDGCLANKMLRHCRPGHHVPPSILPLLFGPALLWFMSHAPVDIPLPSTPSSWHFKPNVMCMQRLHLYLPLTWFQCLLNRTFSRPFSLPPARKTWSLGTFQFPPLTNALTSLSPTPGRL